MQADKYHTKLCEERVIKDNFKKKNLSDTKKDNFKKKKPPVTKKDVKKDYNNILYLYYSRILNHLKSLTESL